MCLLFAQNFRILFAICSRVCIGKVVAYRRHTARYAPQQHDNHNDRSHSRALHDCSMFAPICLVHNLFVCGAAAAAGSGALAEAFTETSIQNNTQNTHTHTDAPRNSLAYFSITICACVFIFYPDAGAAERSRFGRVWDNCARVRIRTNFRVYADFATAERHTNKQLKLYTLEFSFAEDNTHEIFEVGNTNHCMWPSISISNIEQ